MTINENKTVVRQAFEALMSDNRSSLDEFLAPDCILHQCGFLEPFRGVTTIKELPVGALVADHRVRLDRIVGDGDTVAIHWLTTGKYTDPESSSGNTQQVSFMSMSFVQLSDGKITEIWNIQDMSTFWAQLERGGTSRLR